MPITGGVSEASADVAQSADAVSAAEPAPTTPAPNGGWRPLSEAIGMGTSKLQGIVFPDNSSLITEDWNELTVEVVRWLTDNNYPVREQCPIQTPKAKTRYAVAEEPVRPSGEPHDGMIEVNSLWVLNDLHYEFAAGNARIVIERAGMEPSEFKVRW